MGGRSISKGAAVAAPGASAAAMAWRFRGELHVTVVAKATFAFVTDAPMTRAAPRSICWDEVHHGNHPARSIRFASDMAPRLGRADVLFTGHAHLPPTAPGESAPVRLGIFDGATPRLAKTLLVRRKPGSFAAVPIVYERAYGGIGWADNPFGVGCSPGTGEPEILSASGEMQAAGFGPIGRAWPQRRRLAARLSRDALRADVVELPDSFAWDFFQAAPPDQQIPFLKGDEWLVLDSMHPIVPRLRMQLPLVRGMARITGLPLVSGADAQMIDLVLDLLHIDGDERVVSATLRGSFTLSSEDALPALRFVVGVASLNDPIQWPVETEEEEEDSPFERTIALDRSASPQRSLPARSLEGTITLDEDDLIPVSLAADSIDLDSVHAMSVVAVPQEGHPGNQGARRDPRTETIAMVPDLPASALPFRPATSPSPFETASADLSPREGNPLGQTVTLHPWDFEADKQVVPFGSREEPPRVTAPFPPPVKEPPAPPVNVPVPAVNVPVPEVNVPVPAVSAPVPAVEAPAPQAAPAPPKESPWAAPMDAPPPPPAPKPPQTASPPGAAASLKRGLYNRFGKH